MFAILRGHPLTRSPVMAKVALTVQRRNMYCKPPKDRIGAGQTVFTMLVFAFTLLFPAGWIMHHIPYYRSRPPAQP
uniref:Uncharacterized protein n=1 Tax=Denticeps clupeoides TaxID=299321 RepID=A0AAY4AS83_9TELE